MPGDEADVPDTRKRRAVRERDDGGKRDPFILNRFEKILAMAEMVNVDRPSDDKADEDARKAADDLDELAIGRRSGKPATKLKFDLDLPPEALDATPSGRRPALSGMGLSLWCPFAGSLPGVDGAGPGERRDLDAGCGRPPARPSRAAALRGAAAAT